MNKTALALTIMLFLQLVVLFQVLDVKAPSPPNIEITATAQIDSPKNMTYTSGEIPVNVVVTGDASERNYTVAYRTICLNTYTAGDPRVLGTYFDDGNSKVFNSTLYVEQEGRYELRLTISYSNVGVYRQTYFSVQTNQSTLSPSSSPSFISQPTVPEFSVRLISLFPEENTTTSELKIKNQPFDKDNIYHYSLFYNVRTRIADDVNWTDLYNAEDGYPSQSDSDFTVLSFASSINNSDGWFKSTAYTYPHHWIYAPSGAELDIQVEAMIGYRTRSWEPPMLPYVFEGEKSGWSDTQTITISDPSESLPSPTSTSFSPDSSLMIVSVAVSVVVVCVVSLVYFKRNRSEVKSS